MATENIAISKQYLLKAYREAEPSQKEFMKQLFGEDTFASSVMERIKTFQDAVNELGYDNNLVKAYKETMPTCTYTDAKDILAYLKLRIIAAALNEGWQPKFTKDEWRYYPYFYVLTKEEYEHLKDEAKGRCVGRSVSNANADGGLVYAGANGGSAHSVTNSRGAPCLPHKGVSAICWQTVLGHLGRFYFQNRRHRQMKAILIIVIWIVALFIFCAIFGNGKDE